ncbi:MAG: DUF1214 domain-containing protein [Rhodospirillaceae bacterium]|nr:MAG: DUF1214 domain-containing protein [Rhodospirillaceae bacterium]
MTFGDFRGDEDLRAAWRTFCQRLQEAGDHAFKDNNPATPLQRADAFRFLTQNLGQAFDLALETKDTKFPVIHAFCTPFCKLGGDNADFIYQQAWIDGESVYKISGNRGTARFLNFTVQGPRHDKQPKTGWPNKHEPFGDVPEANLFGQELVTEWDGSFELYIGGPKRGPNWLPTTPGSRKLFLRQGFDRWSELPVRMRIERVGMTGPRPMPTPQDMVKAMDWAGRFVVGAIAESPDWQYAYVADIDPVNINQFPTEPREIANAVYNKESDKRRGRSAATMCWKLAPDEALIIEFDNNDIFWMMTNMGVFFSSMDYLYRPVSYTPSRTTVDSDGKIRMILCHDDPGYHNWMDTQGFEKGHLANRNIFSDVGTVFRTQVVKRSELARVLPADTARVTPEERALQLRERFHAILQRYCL